MRYLILLFFAHLIACQDATPVKKEQGVLLTDYLNTALAKAQVSHRFYNEARIEPKDFTHTADSLQAELKRYRGRFVNNESLAHYIVTLYMLKMSNEAAERMATSTGGGELFAYTGPFTPVERNANATRMALTDNIQATVKLLQTLPAKTRAGETESNNAINLQLREEREAIEDKLTGGDRLYVEAHEAFLSARSMAPILESISILDSLKKAER